MKWDWHEIADKLIDEAVPAAAVGVTAFVVGNMAYHRLAMTGLFGKDRQATHLLIDQINRKKRKAAQNTGAGSTTDQGAGGGVHHGQGGRG